MTPEVLLSLFMAEARGVSVWTWSGDAGDALAATQMILSSPAPTRVRVGLLAAEALVVPDGGSGRFDTAWSPALAWLVQRTCGDGTDHDDASLVRLVELAAQWPAWDWLDVPPYDVVIGATEGFLQGRPPSDPLRAKLGDLRSRLAREGAWDASLRQRLERLAVVAEGDGE